MLRNEMGTGQKLACVVCITVAAWATGFSGGLLTHPNRHTSTQRAADVSATLPSAPALPPVPPAMTTERQPIPMYTVNVLALMDHIRNLSETIGRRPVGSDAEKDARNYIETAFHRAGYRTVRERVPMGKGVSETENIIAHLPQWEGKPRLIVGAHYDSHPRSPGANDNASGVAVLLETARLLVAQASAFDVVFVAFAAEEDSHQGSETYVRNIGRRGRPEPVGMINLDEVGYGTVFQIGAYTTEGWLAAHCREAAVRMGVDTCPDGSFRGRGDYAPFARARIPVACISWDTDSAGASTYRHTRKDRLTSYDSQEFQYNLERTTQTLLEALVTPAAFDLPPRNGRHD